MNLASKIFLWVGIVSVLLGSTIPNQIMFKLGFADMVVPPSYEAIVFGICCIVGALAYTAGQSK